jgi:hypothetical protein
MFDLPQAGVANPFLATTASSPPAQHLTDWLRRAFRFATVTLFLPLLANFIAAGYACVNPLDVLID